MVVSALDGAGRKLQSAVVDGVISETQSVSAAEGDFLAPLTDFIVDEPSLKLACLLCYGEDSSGRAEGLAGSDGLVESAAQRILSAGGAGKKSLFISATMIAMELLVRPSDARGQPTRRPPPSSPP